MAVLVCSGPADGGVVGGNIFKGWGWGRRRQRLQRMGVGEEGSGRLEGKQGRVIRFLFFLIRLE